MSISELKAKILILEERISNLKRLKNKIKSDIKRSGSELDDLIILKHNEHDNKSKESS